MTDASGHDANRADDAALVGASVAVLLRAGDFLVMDLDGDHVMDRSPPLNPDRTLVKVTAGQSIVFASDLSGDGRFDAGEITGLATAHGFRGEVYSDIHGDVVTALTTNGSFNSGASAPAIQNASIAGLHVTGRVEGNILAGRDLTGITIDGGAPTGPQSVHTLATGTATQQVPYHFGATIFQEPRTRVDGRSGGNITDILLAHGCTAILSGEGIERFGGDAGDGGDISRVRILHSTGSLTIQAGRGGEAFGGAGGDGGAIAHISAVVAPGGGSVLIGAGVAGGTTSLTAAAGEGGGVRDVRVSLLSDAQNFTIRSGQGGDTPGSQQDIRVLGRGGAGGAIERISLSAPDATVGTITIETGRGGAGRSGGRVADLQFDFDGATGGAGLIAIETGDGGYGQRAGASGGSGGAIGNLAINGGAIEVIRLKTGSGRFDAHDFDDRFLPSVGGSGGAIANVTFAGRSLDQFEATSGTGAVGDSGGAGGSISRITITPQEFVGNFLLTAGAGALAKHGVSGAGGDIVHVRVSAPEIRGSVSLECAEDFSDDFGSDRSVAKRGGAIAGVTLEAAGDIGSGIEMIAGDGGEGISAPGGGGGSISRVAIRAGGDIVGDLKFTSGSGGDGFTRTGRSGGHGGIVDGVSVKAANLMGNLEIATGSGGAGYSAGGDGGDVRRFTLETGQVTTPFPEWTHVGFISIRTGDGGSGGPGGAGGDVVGVSLTATSASRTVSFSAGTGGESGGLGGRGGVLSTIAVNVGTLEGASFHAGSGGDSGPRSGAGGGLRGIRAEFGTVGSVGVSMESGSGGYSEGVARSAGSIETIALKTGASGPILIRAGSSEGDISSGHGGSIRGFTFTALGAVSEFVMNAGDGGASGGDVRGVVLASAFPMPAAITAGNVTAPYEGPGARFGGSIEVVTLQTPAAEMDLVAGYGGHGGDIRFIRGTVGGIRIFAGDGNASPGPQGTWGNGGSVADVRLNAVHSIVGGNSEDGRGGSIARIFVTGDIGDYSPGLASAETGGIFAGVRTKLFDEFGEPIAPLDGRTNGSVTDIRAERIARIVAGWSENPGVFSAAASVQRIRAAAIGIDINGNGAFDFAEGYSGEPGFEVGGDYPDEAIDGLVIVRASGAGAISVPPLKLVRVR